jgi:phosphomannomutase/phosphoglucomutase
MNSRIFREYDIRGEVESDLTDDVATRIGKSFATYMSQKGKRCVAVGRDGRLSSPRLREKILEGLLSGGLKVTDIGVVPTPVFYFSLFHLDLEGGIMITGSHNPSNFNGFKICLGKETIFGPEIQNLRKIAEEGRFVQGMGSVVKINVIPAYQQYIVENIALSRKIRLVVDSGNGTAGLVAPEIFRRLGCEVIQLYSDVDGSFPHHHPDPTLPENMEDLIEEVIRSGAEVGIGYDGDADRLGVVDSEGRILWGDQLMILFAREILRTHPGATIISEVKCSKTLYDDIAQKGGRGIMWKAGHSLLKNKMKEEKALLGGEMSGHMFFADRYFGFDDAIYASCRLLEILSRSQKGLSGLLADVPKTFFTPEIRLDCPDDRKFSLVERIREDFRKEYPIVDVDGVRILLPDGWGLVRASNTQPVLVLRFEADSPQRLKEIQKLVTDKIDHLAKDAGIPIGTILGD